MANFIATKNDNSIKLLNEVYFLNFYSTIIEKEIKPFRNNANLLKMNNDCLAKVIDAFDYKVPQTNTSLLHFDFPEIRCAYLFQYGPCFASTVAYHFRKLLESDFLLFHKLVAQDNVNICCLGGGPATEFVAVVKALELVMFNNKFQRKRPLHITAIVVDIEASWLIPVENIIEKLSEVVDSSKMTFSFSFIEADLTEPFGPDVRNALLKSDVVTMIKFLSAIHPTEEGWRSPEMLKGIIDGMREDGILFFLDSSSVEIFSVFREAIRSFKCMTEIYGPLEYDTYEISPVSKRECLALYSKYYGNRYCAENTKNHVSIWFKMEYCDAEKCKTGPCKTSGAGEKETNLRKKKRKARCSLPTPSTKSVKKEPSTNIQIPTLLQEKTLLSSPDKTRCITVSSSVGTEENGIQNPSSLSQTKSLLPSPKSSENAVRITVFNSIEAQDVQNPSLQEPKTSSDSLEKTVLVSVPNSSEVKEDAIQDPCITQQQNLLPDCCENTLCIAVSTSPDREENGFKDPPIPQQNTLLPSSDPSENTIFITVLNSPKAQAASCQNPPLQEPETLPPSPDPPENSVCITVSKSPEAEQDHVTDVLCSKQSSVSTEIKKRKKVSTESLDSHKNVSNISTVTEEKKDIPARTVILNTKNKKRQRKKNRVVKYKSEANSTQNRVDETSAGNQQQTFGDIGTTPNSNVQPAFGTSQSEIKKRKRKMYRQQKKVSTEIFDSHKNVADISTIKEENKDIPVRTVILNARNKKRQRKKRRVVKYNPQANGTQYQVDKSILGAYPGNQQQTFGDIWTIPNPYVQPAFGSNQGLFNVTQTPTFGNSTFLNYSQQSHFENNQALFNIGQLPMYGNNQAVLIENLQPWLGTNQAYLNFY